MKKLLTAMCSLSLGVYWENFLNFSRSLHRTEMVETCTKFND